VRVRRYGGKNVPYGEGADWQRCNLFDNRRSLRLQNYKHE